MSILEDYDHETSDILEIEDDIAKLCTTLHTIDQYGAPKSAIQILCSSHLLESSSKIALEALLIKEDIALEASVVSQSIVDTIKEKAAKWSAKIVSFFKDKGNAFLKRITNLWDAFKKKLPEVKDKIGDLKDSTTTYAKAHPYKTIAAAIAACAAVIAIVVFTGRMLPTVTNSKAMVQFTNSINSKINAIKWPFGAVASKAVNGGKKITVTVAKVAAVGSVVKLAQLGWSKVTVEQMDRSLEIVCGSVEKAWNILTPKVVAISKGALLFTKASATIAGGGFKTGYNALYNDREPDRVLSETSILKEGLYLGTGAAVAATSVMLFWASSILYGVYKLVSDIIVKTIGLCAQTIGALSHPITKEYI